MGHNGTAARLTVIGSCLRGGEVHPLADRFVKVAAAVAAVVAAAVVAVAVVLRLQIGDPFPILLGLLLLQRLTAPPPPRLAASPGPRRQVERGGPRYH